MESSFAFFTLLSLLLFANHGDARKDSGEYWRAVMKDQPMPEAIQGLIPVQSISGEKTDCHTSTKERNKDMLIEDSKLQEEKHFVKDFEPRPNVSAYPDDIKSTDEKSFVKDFEPRPNVSVYHNEVDPKEDNSFVTDFEPRPNVSIYQE